MPTRHSDLLDPAGLLPRLEAGEVQAIHQSMVGQADICMMRLQYSLDSTLPKVSSEARVVGSAYHAGAAHYYDARMTGFPGLDIVVPDAYAKAAEEFEEVQHTDNGVEVVEVHWDSDPEKALQKVMSMLYRYFSEGHFWPEDHEVLGVELPFIVPSPWSERWVLAGTMDLVLRTPDGRALIPDHKTARRPWKKEKHDARHNNQPDLYTWVFTQLFPDLGWPGFCFDVMTYDGVFERRWADRTPQQVEAALQKAERLTKILDAQVPGLPNTQHFLCSPKWCDTWHHCPFGEALK